MDETGFNLEQAMNACWNTADDLRLLYEEALGESMDSEKIANAISGVAELHDLRCAKAKRIFEELIRNGSLSLFPGK